MTYRVSLMTPSIPQSIRHLRREMDRAFEQFVPVAEGAWVPATDIVEQADGWTVTLDLPGVRPDALEVLAENRILTVRGERAGTPRADGDRAMSLERRSGAFARQFRLPPAADAEQLSAELAHGVLTLRIGKVAPAQPRRVPVATPIGEEHAPELGNGRDAGSASVSA